MDAEQRKQSSFLDWIAGKILYTVWEKVRLMLWWVKQLLAVLTRRDVCSALWFRQCSYVWLHLDMTVEWFSFCLDPLSVATWPSLKLVFCEIVSTEQESIMSNLWGPGLAPGSNKPNRRCQASSQMSEAASLFLSTPFQARSDCQVSGHKSMIFTVAEALLTRCWSRMWWPVGNLSCCFVAGWAAESSDMAMTAQEHWRFWMGCISLWNYRRLPETEMVISRFNRSDHRNIIIKLRQENMAWSPTRRSGSLFL